MLPLTKVCSQWYLMSVNYTFISSGVHSHWVMSVNNTPVTDSVHSHYPFGVNLVGFHTKNFTVWGHISLEQLSYALLN